jgi:hypothetical protein
LFPWNFLSFPTPHHSRLIPSPFDHVHRLPTIRFPLTPPCTLHFLFSLFISCNCPLTSSLSLLSQLYSCHWHNGYGSETVPSRGQSPLQDESCFELEKFFNITPLFRNN